METYSFYVRVLHIRVVGIVEPVVAIVKAIHVVSVKFEGVRGVNGELIPRYGVVCFKSKVYGRPMQSRSVTMTKITLKVS